MYIYFWPTCHPQFVGCSVPAADSGTVQCVRRPAHAIPECSGYVPPPAPVRLSRWDPDHSHGQLWWRYVSGSLGAAGMYRRMEGHRCDPQSPACTWVGDNGGKRSITLIFLTHLCTESVLCTWVVVSDNRENRLVMVCSDYLGPLFYNPLL